MKNNTKFKNATFLFCTITLLSGVAYFICQILIVGNVEDPIFIGLLMANTVVIARVVTFLELKVMDVECAGLKDFHKDIFNLGKACFLGVLFFIVFFVVTVYVSPFEVSDQYRPGSPHFI